MQEKNQLQNTKSPKFMADGMIFGLVNWLILLGYDVEKRRPAKKISNQLFSDRIFLTKSSRGSEEESQKRFIIKSNSLWEQIKEIVNAFPIDFKATFLMRCSKCNKLLEDVNISEVKDKIPPLVAERISQCRRCSSCTKIYWDGTHCDRMRKTIKENLGIDF